MHLLAYQNWMVSVALALVLGGVRSGAFAESTASNGIGVGAIRTIVFPKATLGTLCLSAFSPKSLEQSNFSDVCAAVGTVKIPVPANRMLSLEAGRLLLEKPAILDTLDPTALDGIKISFMSMDESEGAMCDKALTHVHHLQSLKFILLDRSDASDAGVKSLKKMPHLRQLSAPLSSITGGFLSEPANLPEMAMLSLFDCRLDEKFLDYLPRFPKLIYVDFHHTGLGPIGLKGIGNCPNLEILRISQNPRINNESLKYLTKLKHLRRLELEETAVTMDGIKWLPKELPILTLSRASFTPDQMVAIHKLYPHSTVEFANRGKKVDQTNEALYAPLH